MILCLLQFINGALIAHPYTFIQNAKGCFCDKATNESVY